MHTCIHAYMHAYIHTCIHAYIHACIHTCICICICMYIIYLYIYTCICIHIIYLSVAMLFLRVCFCTCMWELCISLSCLPSLFRFLSRATPSSNRARYFDKISRPSPFLLLSFSRSLACSLFLSRACAHSLYGYVYILYCVWQWGLRWSSTRQRGTVRNGRV